MTTRARVEVFGREERRIFARLKSPGEIQTFLDGLAYSTDDFLRSPRQVLADRRAHCADGAAFAAAALRRLGHRPRVVELVANGRDEHHLLAVFQVGGLWGAVSKSNFVGLRYRDPVYRTLRELAMSYFDSFFNLEREKTLRAYTAPLDLARFDHLAWETSNEHLEWILHRTIDVRWYWLFDGRVSRRLRAVDERSFKAGLMGADGAGLYRPGGK